MASPSAGSLCKQVLFFTPTRFTSLARPLVEMRYRAAVQCVTQTPETTSRLPEWLSSTHQKRVEMTSVTLDRILKPLMYQMTDQDTKTCGPGKDQFGQTLSCCAEIKFTLCLAALRLSF